MANKSGQVNRAAGVLALGLVLLILGTVLALALRAQGFALHPADWAAVAFTLKQAALSAALSCALAVPVARALHRRRFVGRGALIAVMGAPFLLPVVVAVVGILSVYGRGGVLNQMLTALHLPPVSVFGLQGVLLTNVFFNLPLVTRMVLNGWQAIPAERFRLAETLGLPPKVQRRHLEYPMLREVLPGAMAVVFLLCLTSFVVSLTFGGGPKATTLELAIYQALRFDFDLGRAALLACVQFGICAVTVLAVARVQMPSGLGVGRDRAWQGLSGGAGLDGVVLTLTALFLLTPLASVLMGGMAAVVELSAQVWWAALRSVIMAVLSGGMATAAALCLALGVARGMRGVELAAMLPMAASGLVLGTGLFLITRPFATPEQIALPVTVLVNAVMALPFVVRLILPEARAMVAAFGPLEATLGLRGLARLRFVTLPRLARPLGFGAGIAMSLAMGDLGVIALFGGEVVTLPLVISRLAGAYRLDQAAAASLVLVVLSFTLFALCDAKGRHAAS